MLRRPPLGQLLASAHDVARESRIMAALEHTGVSVPRIFGVAQDPEISQVPLVLLAFINVQVVDTIQIAESLTPHQRRQIGVSLPRTLAKIHGVDINEVGLSYLASHQPYAGRQLKRWAGQWERSKTRELPELDDLTRRLVVAAPEQRELSLVHSASIASSSRRRQGTTHLLMDNGEYPGILAEDPHRQHDSQWIVP